MFSIVFPWDGPGHRSDDESCWVYSDGEWTFLMRDSWHLGYRNLIWNINPVARLWPNQEQHMLEEER